MSREIILIVPIKAKTECREEVREKLLNLATLTNQEAGNICYCLHEIEGEPDQFVIYEKWRGQAALDFHMEQAYLKDFLASGEALLAEPVKGQFCRQIS